MKHVKGWSLPAAMLILFVLHISIPLKTCFGIYLFITMLLIKPPAIVGILIS